MSWTLGGGAGRKGDPRPAEPSVTTVSLLTLGKQGVYVPAPVRPDEHSQPQGGSGQEWGEFFNRCEIKAFSVYALRSQVILQFLALDWR